MEAIILNGIHGDGALKRVFEVYEAEVEFSATLGRFFN